MKKFLIVFFMLMSISAFANCDVTVSSDSSYRLTNSFKESAVRILEDKGYSVIDFIIYHERSSTNLRLSIGTSGMIPLTTKAIVVLVENAQRPGWGETIERFEKRTFARDESSVILKTIKKVTHCSKR